MPSNCYKIWEWGQPVGIGVTAAVRVGVQGVAKAATAGLPNTVTNELVCGYLARSLGLPVPPGFLVEKDGVPYHVSLNFYLAGESLPPADAAALVAAQPELACGIILFDAWVLNGDRHQGNLAFDTTAGLVMLFDHSHAFLSPGGDWRQRFANLQDQLGLGGHCLVPHIRSVDGFRRWQDRLEQLPRYVLEDALATAVSDSFTENDAAECLDYLAERRDRLSGIVDANRAIFRQVPADLWSQQFGGVS